MPAQGKMDIEGMQKDIKEGLDDVEMFEKYPIGWAKFERVLKRYRVNLIPNRTEPTQAIWVYGDTGMGKSRWVLQDIEGRKESWATVYVGKKGDRIWLDDDAIGVKNLIVEDFEGEWHLKYMLKLLDRYALKAETKGGWVKIVATRVYFTSNMHPKAYYQGAGWGRKNPLWRRFHENGEIKHFTLEWKPPVTYANDEHPWELRDDATNMGDVIVGPMGPRIEKTDLTYVTAPHEMDYVEKLKNIEEQRAAIMWEVASDCSDDEDDKPLFAAYAKC